MLVSPVIRPAQETAFLSHLYIKTIILPRQARDKHRESTQKKDASFFAPKNSWIAAASEYVLQKTPFYASFYHNRLGTNIGKTQKRAVVSSFFMFVPSLS
jgi:hypothetical protein